LNALKIEDHDFSGLNGANDILADLFAKDATTQNVPMRVSEFHFF